MQRLASGIFGVTRWSVLQRLTGRAVTTSVDQQKRHELSKLGTNRDFLDDKPEKQLLRKQLASRSPALNVATRAIQQHAKRNDFYGGWEVFLNFKREMAPDGPLYDSALNLCAKAVWYEQGQTVWKEMPEECKTVVSYTTMMDLFARCKRVNQAEELFASMLGNGIEPNMITYCALLKSFSMTGQPEKALQTFRELHSNNIFLQATDLRSKQTLYQVVMVALARAGDYAMTRELFMEMTAKGISADKGHYTALMMALAPNAEAATAQGVFDCMAPAGVVPDVACYTILMACSRNDVQRCKEIWKSMPMDASAFTYQELVKAHILASDGAGARDIIKIAKSKDKLLGGTMMRSFIEQAERLP